MTLSKETVERMDGLTTTREFEYIEDSISNLKYDLMDDGFEMEEINIYLINKISELVISTM